LVVVGVGYRYLFANEAYADIFGLDAHQIVGRRVPEVLPAAWPQIQPRLDRAFAGEKVDYELTVSPVSGTRTARFCTVVYEPRAGDSGEATVVVVVVDISERKRVEDALRASEARYRFLFERNLAGVAVTDEDGAILDANDAAARIFGVGTRDELLWLKPSCATRPSPAGRSFSGGRMGSRCGLWPT
jgi:PAS domain S-box-containing protein